MAAYASLLSPGHIIDQISQHTPRQLAVLDKAQIDSLLENITFLQDFLEDFSLMRGDEIEALEEKIATSAYAAEDIIESFVVDQILQNSVAERRWSGIFSCLDFVSLCFKNPTLPNVSRSSALFSSLLNKVIEEIGSMKKDVMKIKETEGKEQPRKAATAGSFIRDASNSKNTMVGFDEDLIQIMEKLTGHQSNLRIIPIVGMGGIGKTTLATNVYHDPLIIHAWVAICQRYSLHGIILSLLKDVLTECRKEEGDEEITQLTDEELGELLYKSLTVEELGELLYKNLSGRKYLIVMDDLWSIECWNAIKKFFPDNNMGSRVMITTRLTSVADDFRSCAPHQLHFLDKDQSWALFCDKVFGKESCPPELVEVGKTIVRNCRGLPLAIVAISGLLAKSSRMVEYWECVSNDTNAALNKGGDGLCIEILSLSYKYLPVHLKPCFLYMAMFPEDHEIRISRLIKLWVAEGILKPIRSRSLEEIAVENLKDLVDRNLILVHDYGSRKKIKTCTIHDLLRDLCLREAQKEKFLCVTTMDSLNNHSGIIVNKRRLIIQRSSDEEECQQQAFDAINLASCTRSLICCELESTSIKLPVCFRLLRVLSMNGIYSCKEILQLVNSRYIDFKAPLSPEISLKSISLLWNLQSITIASSSSQLLVYLPAEIWEMPQLRHVKSVEGDFSLPDPLSTKIKNGTRDFFILKNLQTLCKIRNFRCTYEVIRRIPNLKKLGVTYMHFNEFFEWDDYEVSNLVHLCNLESLFLDCGKEVLQNMCFPHSLKKLTLSKCRVSWEDLTVVGSLPHLEVLKLINHAVSGREWNPVEGQFLELKSLQIERTDLEEWIAESYHFPRLENLVLGFVEDLKEIPYGIGEIQTLQSISLVDCNDSVISSAKKIQDEQQNLGNYDLQVHVSFRRFEPIIHQIEMHAKVVRAAMLFSMAMASS